MLYNQRAPEWDAPLEHNELDVNLSDSSGQPLYIDVSIVDPLSANAGLLRRRARAAGSGIRTREKAKHTRYPDRRGVQLVPFVLGGCGRWGREATAFAKETMSSLDDLQQRHEMMFIRQAVAATLHRGKAELMLSSSVVGNRPWTRPGSLLNTAHRAARRGSLAEGAAV